MAEPKVHNLIIIGSGPAGYTAAIYAGRAELKPLVIQGQILGGTAGGQLTMSPIVDNFPGFPEGITGTELMDRMQQQAEKFGAELVAQDVKKVNFKTQPFTLETGDGTSYQAKAVIVATGASARWLGVKGETELKGFGVSVCATCDGAFFKNKKVVVVGGGDSALTEANFLTKFAETVTIVYRKDKESLRASKIVQERAEKNPKVKFLFNQEIIEIKDTKARKVTGVVLKNTQDGSTAEMPTDGVFLAIGHKPNTEIFQGQIELDETTGYIKTQPDGSMTSVTGVFAAGDIADHRYRQAITAAASGARAALDAGRWLAEQE